MNLVSLRRYAVRNRCRIGFRIEPAGECMIDEHGVLKIPSLKAAPGFNVDSLLGSVEQFFVETGGEAPKRQKLSRQQLEALLAEAPKAEPGGEE
jgi:hypothetical protein